MYRIYLRDFQGHVPAETKTITSNQAAASEAFACLVNRTDLDGQKLAAVLSYNNRQLAFHRFDRPPGSADYWRDKFDEIDWPDEMPITGRGGARPGAGVKPETTDGGALRRVTITVDQFTENTLTPLGNGNFSEGVRRAARIVSGGEK